jgi:hypothetical protein
MSKGHGERLSRKHEQAIVALLGQPTVEKAAQAVGVNEKTLRNWMKLPAFLAAYRDARREIVEGAITRLQQLCNGAVLTLNRNLTCGTPSVEVRAAEAILDRSCQALDLGDVLERIEALEQRLAGGKRKGPRTTGRANPSPPAE